MIAVADSVSVSVPKKKPLAQHLSTTAEWGTPPEIVAFAKSLYEPQGIDLDPATSEAWNEVVGARDIFTKETDGLKSDWGNARRVFLNAPGSKDGKLTRAFYAKAVNHVLDVPDRRVLWVGFSVNQLQFIDPRWPILILRSRLAYMEAPGVASENPSHISFLQLLGDDPGYRFHMNGATRWDGCRL